MRSLYRAAFGVRSPGRRLQPVFRYDDSLVAAVADAIVGIGCTAPADRDLDPLLACLEPSTRRILEPLGRHPVFPGEPPPVVIEAPMGLQVARQPRDRLFTALAVDDRWRRRGIGRALAVGRLALALRDGATQVFVHCVAGSGSRQLYESLGFVPLVRLAHHYGDGSGMTLLWRRLR